MHISNLLSGMHGVLETVLHTGEVPLKAPTARRFTVFCQDDEWSNVFINAMSFLTNHAVDALLDVYDFSRFDTVMDVGGGQED